MLFTAGIQGHSWMELFLILIFKQVSLVFCAVDSEQKAILFSLLFLFPDVFCTKDFLVVVYHTWLVGWLILIIWEAKNVGLEESFLSVAELLRLLKRFSLAISCGTPEHNGSGICSAPGIMCCLSSESGPHEEKYLCGHD